MKLLKSLSTVSLLLLAFISTNAQVAVVNEIQSDSFNSTSIFSKKQDFYPAKSSLQLKSFILPAALVTYGAVTMSSHGANSLNGKIQEEVWIDKPHSSKHYDTYLMFAPAVSVYALNAFGVKGKNNFRDRSMIYLMSNIFVNAIVYPTKKLTKQLRPDGSNNNSFPSGHTATAFASAEFMRMEYKNVSPWYGVAGYAMAATTGYLRMYNNKHWFSDVIAGAGSRYRFNQISLLAVSQNSACHCLKTKIPNTVIMPTYQSGAFGLGLIHKFY